MTKVRPWRVPASPSKTAMHPVPNYYLPDGSVKKGVTKGSVVTYFGQDVASFSEAFASLGVVKVEV